MSVIVESEFKGNPVLGIKFAPEDSFPAVQFGARKAMLILAHVDDIRKFAEKHLD